MRGPGANLLMITHVPVSCESGRIFASTPSPHCAQGRSSWLRCEEMASVATVVMTCSLWLLDTVALEQVQFLPMRLAAAARALAEQGKREGFPPVWELPLEQARMAEGLMGQMDTPI